MVKEVISTQRSRDGRKLRKLLKHLNLLNYLNYPTMYATVHGCYLIHGFIKSDEIFSECDVCGVFHGLSTPLSVVIGVQC